MADQVEFLCLKFRRLALRFVRVFEENCPTPYLTHTNEANPPPYEPVPVDYADSVPTLNLILDPYKAWGACVFTKSSHWSYENEWCVLVPPAPSQDVTGSGWHPPCSGALAGVIFGCEISREDEQKLREWIKMGGIRVPLYRAARKPDRFELEIREAD